MKLYLVKLSKNRLNNFANFCSLYSINILFSWSDETLFETNFFIYINDAPGSGITTEEKARLINETFLKDIIKTNDVQ
jgi:hypothetical protein